jgi:hypothetical protein
MRIAVSGTHCAGKSTLIDEFLLAHPDYIHEPEPYTVLVEELGEEFSAEPCIEDFLRQLDFNINRLATHAIGEEVIYERCPLDFLAYIEVLEPKLIAPLLGPISTALKNLDLLIFLPIEPAVCPAPEYPKLRKAVDQRLNTILLDDEFGIISVPVVEATGSTAQRLRIIEETMKNLSRGLSI